MNFYLYSYAICISVASHLASDILNGNKETLDKYLKYIKTGSNVTPLDTFKILGVDLEKEDVYLDAIKYFDSLSETFNIKDTDNHLTGFDNTFYYNMDFNYNVKNISFLDTMLLKHIFITPIRNM